MRAHVVSPLLTAGPCPLLHPSGSCLRLERLSLHPLLPSWSSSLREYRITLPHDQHGQRADATRGACPSDQRVGDGRASLLSLKVRAPLSSFSPLRETFCSLCLSSRPFLLPQKNRADRPPCCAWRRCPRPPVLPPLALLPAPPPQLQPAPASIADVSLRAQD